MSDIVSESARDQWGGYQIIWMVPMPAAGVAFKVIRERWNDEYGIRTIHEIELVP